MEARPETLRSMISVTSGPEEPAMPAACFCISHIVPFTKYLSWEALYKSIASSRAFSSSPPQRYQNSTVSFSPESFAAPSSACVLPASSVAFAVSVPLPSSAFGALSSGLLPHPASPHNIHRINPAAIIFVPFLIVFPPFAALNGLSVFPLYSVSNSMANPCIMGIVHQPV